MTTKLQLELLGAPSFTLGGTPLRSLRYSKAEALLFYLAMTGRSHSREALATLLWSDIPDEAARTNLRSLLSTVVRAVLSPHLPFSQCSPPLYGQRVDKKP